MKITKRILVAILALALLASVFALSVSAETEDVFRNEGMDSPEDILEYYQNRDYLADNYDDGTWSEEFLDIDSDYDHTNSSYAHYPELKVETTDNPTDPTASKVLSVNLPQGKSVSYSMYAENKALLTENILLSFDVYFDESCMNTLNYQLKAGTFYENSDGTLKANSATATIMGVTFIENELNITYDAEGNKLSTPIKNSTPVFYYSAWNSSNRRPNFYGTNRYQIFEGMTPEVGKWYDIAICIDAAGDNFYFTITDEDGNKVESEKLDMTKCGGIWGFDCIGTYKATATNKTTEMQSISADYCIDNMEIYEGSFRRNPSYKKDYTRTHLEDLITYYDLNEGNVDERLRVADVLNFLYNECDTTEFPQELRDVIPNAYEYINQTYADSFLIQVENINRELNYYERLAHTAIIEKYESLLRPNEELPSIPGMTSEYCQAVVDGRVTYAEELAELETIKAQSEQFISLINECEAWMSDDQDPTNRDFWALNEFYAEASSNKYAKRDRVYANANAQTVEEADEYFAEFEAMVLRMNEDVESFITHVTTMEISVSFGALYAAYLDAYKYYNQYGEPGLINPNFDQETHDELMLKLNTYFIKAPVIEAKQHECEEFNRIVNEAAVASYYTTILDRLNEAKAYYSFVQLDYPGVRDSVEIYDDLWDAIADAENAAEAYINAVNSINGKKTFYEKKMAVEAALILKQHGDVLGYAGVNEANIALSNAEREINVLVGNSNTLMTTVAALKEAKTLKERRELIHIANKAAENVEDTIAGVMDALDALEAEIEAFNADVQAANDTLASATEKAQAVVSTVGNAAIFVEGAAE